MRTEKTRKTRKKRSRRFTTIILIIIFFVGLSVLLYPSIANWWNARVQTRAIANYNEAVDALSERDYTAILEAAEDYNERLRQVGSAAAITNPNLVDGYWDTLDVGGTGIMGYVTIDKIDVELPIYHGTDDSVLQVAAGHIQGTSLPIGGTGTHAVISAHRGLPSSLLFTHLDRMEVGDTFTITVLNEVLTYEVDQISIVLPTEIENLYIDPDQDYVTLMTCTPYAVNTHRLLVRGHRIPTVNGMKITSEAVKINSILVAPFIALPMLIALLIWFLVRTRKSRKNMNAVPPVIDQLTGGGSGAGAPTDIGPPDDTGPPDDS